MSSFYRFYYLRGSYGGSVCAYSSQIGSGPQQLAPFRLLGLQRAAALGQGGCVCGEVVVDDYCVRVSMSLQRCCECCVCLNM